MNTSELMADIARLGIRLEAHGDRLRYHPRSAVTPDLAEQPKVHKAELLVILRPQGGAPPDVIATTVMPAGTQRHDSQNDHDGDRDVDRGGDAPRWIERTDPDGLLSYVRTDAVDLEMIDPPTPCPKCGRLDLWETLAGNWRCLRCDPPTTARRLRERAAQLRKGPHRIAQD